MMYRLEALDNERRIVGVTEVAWSELGDVIVVRLPGDATMADADMVRTELKTAFPHRRSIVVVAGDVEFLRLVEVPDGKV